MPLSTIKILILTEGFPPDHGGVATSTHRIAKNLIYLDADVTVLTYLPGDLTQLNQKPHISNVESIKVVRLGPFFKAAGTDFDATPNPSHRAFMRRRFVDNAVAFIRDQDSMPDVIFSMYLMNAGFLATHISSVLNIPHVAGIRGNDIGRNLFDPAALYSTRFILERATKIVAVNNHLMQRMLSCFPDLHSKSLVINNSISPLGAVDKWQARRDLLTRTGWPENSLICCFIGNMREKKGCVELIDAITQLSHNNSHIRLLLISPRLGLTEQALIGQGLAKLISQGFIFHTGALPREEVGPIAAGADIILQPSLEDGMANSLLEGMSLGLCPVVSGIFSDVIQNNIGGIVLQKVDSDNICDAIHLLSDKNKLLAFQAAAKRRSLDFLPLDEASTYLALFEDIISNSATGMLASATL